MASSHVLEKLLGKLLRNVHAGESKLFRSGFKAPFSIVLQSPAFDAGAFIPSRYRGEGIGKNISPPLTWSDAPAGTLAFAVVIEDPDVPLPWPFVHALAYWPAALLSELPEGALSGIPLKGLHRGVNTSGKWRYVGPRPLPGHGLHRYVFQLFALDIEPDLPAPFKRRALAKALRGHVLAIGQMTGVCERR
ncbi:MAG: YbhB/YbcL family Raf kinase inhibitor-like protein [Beijerinckiaceae bacterium]|nr:YbhB/YbcL family Raf kinase inhibitor-like protein [Beijerinckiaceae bacterium]